jgi:hypothetical protein
MIGAIETETRLPRGIRAGNADAKAATTVQKATPAKTAAPSVLPGTMEILGEMPYAHPWAKYAATPVIGSAKALTVTSVTM